MHRIADKTVNPVAVIKPGSLDSSTLVGFKGGTIRSLRRAACATCAVWLILFATKPPLWAAESSLTADTTLSTEGYFVLSWASLADAVALQQSDSPGFLEFTSRDLPGSGQITITGLEDGDYYFRLLGDDGTVTEPLVIEVQHHPLSRALLFFSLGLILFLILLSTIYIGNRRTQS